MIDWVSSLNNWDPIVFSIQGGHNSQWLRYVLILVGAALIPTTPCCFDCCKTTAVQSQVDDDITSFEGEQLRVKCHLSETQRSWIAHLSGDVFDG